MKIITTAPEMMKIASQYNIAGENVGFVPTMGALHDGHVSLIKEAKRNNDKVVVSVFVNPTQFNQASDLDNYPRTFDADRAILENESVDVMFFPSVGEIYPNSESPMYEMDGLDLGMEGPNRPGHFNGVVQVVSRLFDLTKPQSAYFGEKDFQQLAIIKHMTRKLGYDIEIIGCPTLRESGGLAMSSRNTRLTTKEREEANQISQALLDIKVAIDGGELPDTAVQSARKILKMNLSLELEYLELVNPQTLKPISSTDSDIQACIAVWLNGVRLIDNMRVK